MKKTFIIVIIMIVAVAISGCGVLPQNVEGQYSTNTGYDMVVAKDDEGYIVTFSKDLDDLGLDSPTPGVVTDATATITLYTTDDLSNEDIKWMMANA